MGHSVPSRTCVFYLAATLSVSTIECPKLVYPHSAILKFSADSLD